MSQALQVRLSSTYAVSVYIEKRSMSKLAEESQSKGLLVAGIEDQQVMKQPKELRASVSINCFLILHQKSSAQSQTYATGPCNVYATSFVLNITTTVGITHPKRSSTPKMKLVAKKPKFDHKRNKGQGNRPLLISGSISEMENTNSGSESDT